MKSKLESPATPSPRRSSPVPARQHPWRAGRWLHLLVLLGCAATPLRAELSRGLVGYYPFDTPGTTQPNRASALTGTGFPDDAATLIQQAAISTSGARVGAGALLLDGAGDYARVLGKPVNINADWSVSVWFRPDTAGLGLDGTRRYQVIETSGGTFPISYALRGDGGSAEQTRAEMTSQANVATGLPSSFFLNDNQTDAWHHILITYDSGTNVMRGYLDGASRHVFSVDDLLDYSGFHLGTYRLANDRWFKGRMDEVAIWQRALSKEEVTQVFLLGSGGRPLFTDSDSDGLADTWELDEFENLAETAEGDPDEDGLNNAREYANDSSPTNPDTDDDGLRDGAEVDLHNTRPDLRDTDGDGRSDGEELANNPASNPTLPDTDGDGLKDGLEHVHQTFPTVADSDGDGFTDLVEVASGTDPRGATSFPESVAVSGVNNIIISEFVANSWNGLNDEDLESSDWIELWNPTASAVDLTGFHLTDDPANATKWAFPARALNPGGRLLVFASGKNRAPVTGNLHTNFELSANGGYLALSNAAGIPISVFSNYPEQRVNVSYGFFGATAPLAAGWLGVISPGSENPASGMVERVRDTTFSARRGFYEQPFDVTVTTPTAGATLAFTTDGTLPSLTHGTQVPASNETVAPSVTIPISTTTTLRVLAHKTGLLPTNVDTQTYLFPAAVLNQLAPPAGSESLTWGRLGPDWAMDPDVVASPDTAIRIVPADLTAIPTVSLVLPFADMWGINGIYPEGEGIPRDASFELLNRGSSKLDPNAAGSFQARGQVHIFGGSTAVRWKMDKLSMRFRFADDLREEVFSDTPARRFNSLVLDARSNNTWNHPIAEQRARGDYTRDEVTADLQNALGGHAPHSQHVHVYINGLYWGVYTLHERPDHHFAKEYLGGDAAEYSAQKHNAADVIRGPVQNGVHTSADYVALLALANADLSLQPNYEALAAKLDVPDFIRYMLVNYVAGNWDWGNHNWYATFNRIRPEGRWRFHSWDAEHTFRDAGEDFTGKNDSQGPTRIQHQLQLSAEYRLLFADGIRRHLFPGGKLSSAALQGAFETRLRSIHEAIRGESARWGDNYDVTFARTRRTWLREAARILGYVPSFPNNPETVVPAGPVLPGQSAAILGHFRARGWYPDSSGASGWTAEAPEFNQHGGDVEAGFGLTMTKVPAAAAGTVYFTLDGSDPRVPFTGAVHGSAQTHSGSLILNQSALVKARVLAGTQWSPLTEAYFTVNTVPASAANLVVSEIMYHPLPPSAAESAAGYGDSNDFEYVELLNISSRTVDLSGVTLADAISFSFNTLPIEARLLPPGGRVLLAENADALRARHGSATPVTGVFSGNLSNGGERIVLAGSSGIIREFSYDDVAPWPAPADGSGYSLVLNHPRSAPDHAAGLNWRASAWLGGKPGEPDAIPAPQDLTGDANGDGANNLLDYATAGRPQVVVQTAPILVGDQMAEYFVIRHSTNRAADGFSLVVETSTDLVKWESDCVHVSTEWRADGTAVHAWRSAKPLAELGPRFYARVKVRMQ